MMRGWCRVGGALVVVGWLLGGVVVGTVAAQDYDDELPANTLGASTSFSGLTGLVTTATAHTLPPWHVALSGAGSYMQQDIPDQNVIEARAIVGVGLPAGLELTAMVPGMRVDGPTGTNTGFSDARLAGKWRFLDQREAQWPSMALATVLTLPTGDRSKGLRIVDNYGVEIKVLASAEVDFSPDHYAIGLYIDGGLFFQDLGEATQDKYGTFAVGTALPLVMHADTPLSSPLQLLVELSGTYERGAGQDFYVFTPGLRYAGPVTVTASFQYTSFEQGGLDDGIGGILQVGLILP